MNLRNSSINLRFEINLYLKTEFTLLLYFYKEDKPMGAITSVCCQAE